MRNYIILNGQNSNSISGLLIQSLAPISKPLMRTEVEEIDGRDGDITTKLGYSAYDKEITIGLYGNYDINEVIAYFNSEGTVIFSNEPDKYYNYQIAAQIDFERLVRYRTATVTMHVQPFKYASDEKARTFEVGNMLSFNNWSKTTNGVTVTALNGSISVSGTASTSTEFYLPINRMTLAAESYTLSATASGANATSASIRVIGSSPSNADSFGGGYITLQNNATATKTATLEASASYNYVWFYITAGTAMNFTLTLSMIKNGGGSIAIANNGNIYSKPAITVYGTGTINMSLNNVQLFVIELGDTANYLTIDSSLLEAYQGTTDTLMNRYVDGDYDNLRFNIGTNTISWTGSLTKIVVENYSRWL